MKTVKVVLTCSFPECGQTMKLDKDHLPPGWWKDDRDREMCPRHRVHMYALDRKPEDVRGDAILEHSGARHDT